MTSDQLTELSAKAIGLKLTDAPTDNGARIIAPECGGGFWNPLQSNDCIVRLIVDLGLGVENSQHAVCDKLGTDCEYINWQPHQGRAAAMAALRLAVTTLAARIGMETEE